MYDRPVEEGIHKVWVHVFLLHSERIECKNWEVSLSGPHQLC